MAWNHAMHAKAGGPSKSVHAGRICLAAILLLVAASGLAPAQTASRQTVGAPGPANAVAVPDIGIKLAPLTQELRTRYAIAHAYGGPVVTEVEPNGPAAQGLNAGDEIVQIGSDLVSTPEDVVNDVEALKQPGRSSAVFDVVSPEGYLRFVNIRLRNAASPANKS